MSACRENDENRRLPCIIRHAWAAYSFAYANAATAGWAAWSCMGQQKCDVMSVTGEWQRLCSAVCAGEPCSGCCVRVCYPAPQELWRRLAKHLGPVRPGIIAASAFKAEKIANPTGAHKQRRGGGSGGGGSRRSRSGGGGCRGRGWGRRPPGRRSKTRSRSLRQPCCTSCGHSRLRPRQRAYRRGGPRGTSG